MNISSKKLIRATTSSIKPEKAREVKLLKEP